MCSSWRGHGGTRPRGSAQELDAQVAKYFDKLFITGQGIETANAQVASLFDFMPELRRSRCGELPRSLTIVKTWGKRNAPRQRLPMPFFALRGTIGDFLAMSSQNLLALKWLTGFECHLRPGENDSLWVKMVIKPSQVSGPSYRSWGLLLAPHEDQVPSRTALYDEVMTFDTDPDVLPPLARLVTRCSGHERLWPMSPKEDFETFNSRAKRMGLDRVGVARYSLRHRGASNDILTKRRSLKNVMRRGRWQTDQSLRRYAKETRLLAEINKVNPDVMAIGGRVARRLGDILDGRVAVQSLKMPLAPRRM